MDEMSGGTRAGVSTMRLYGGLIALASGGYAVYRSLAPMELSGSAWFMLVLGGVVIVHGVVLFTPAAGRLSGVSGWLMMGYAVLMLAQQTWLGMGMGGGMDGMGGMGGMNGAVAMSWDLGMVVLALLMLASGVVMAARRDGTM